MMSKTRPRPGKLTGNEEYHFIEMLAANKQEMIKSISIAGSVFSHPPRPQTIPSVHNLNKPDYFDIVQSLVS